MRKPPAGAPLRWTEGGAQDGLSRRAGQLFNVPPLAPLGPVRREQIAHRLATSASQAHGGLALLAKATGVLAVASGITVGVMHYTLTSRPPARTEATVVAPAAREPVAAPPEARAVPAETALPSAGVSPGGSEGTRGATKVATARPVHVRKETRDFAKTPAASHAPSTPLRPPPLPPSVKKEASRPGPQAEPSAPEAPSYHAPPVTREEETEAAPAPRSEPRLLADALASLRAQGDAKGALALLAEYRRRFPRGTLRSEARVAEVEALLSLDRRAEALRVLDGLVIERLPRGTEAGLLRAELRAEAGRCAEAIADFDRCAAARNCSGELEERALFGRASCRGKLGQAAAARADLERYLLRFPHGRRSEAVRRALAEKR